MGHPVRRPHWTSSGDATGLCLHHVKHGILRVDSWRGLAARGSISKKILAPMTVRIPFQRSQPVVSGSRYGRCYFDPYIGFHVAIAALAWRRGSTVVTVNL